MRPIQNVLNSAARVVLKMSKFQHITAAVRDQLHWLPVKQRVEFKQALFMYKVLPPSDSSTLSTCVTVSLPVSTRSTRRHLRSAADRPIRKAKFSCVCSANLELTTDDRSQRFYFNDQFQCDVWKLNCFAELTELTFMWQLTVNSLREHKFSYILTYLLTKFYYII